MPVRNVIAKEITVLRVSSGLIDQNHDAVDQKTKAIRVYKTRPTIH